MDTELRHPDGTPDDTSGKKIGRAPDAVSRALRELAQRVGPLTTGELARITGMSATFIRKEIETGYLQAVRIGRGRKCVFRIAAPEALRYVRALGIV